MTTKETISAQDELREVAEIYREADEQEKEAADVKKSARGPLLDLMSEVVREEVTLQQRNEEVEVDEDFDVETWRKRNFPTWNVVGVQPTTEGTYIITLEESDQFKKYEFTHGGFKFGRTVRMKDAGFEVEAFKEHVSQMIDQDEVKDLLLGTIKEKQVIEYVFDEGAANALMADRPELVPVFQQFVNPGRPEVSLLPIKPVKESDEV